jgi:heme/copper-type cytochrome/quinol oxidase subunit 3
MSAAILFLILFVIYFVPSFIAKSRDHHNAGAIFALNLFLGWTFIGWVASLVWALTATRTAGSVA